MHFRLVRNKQLDSQLRWETLRSTMTEILMFNNFSRWSQWLLVRLRWPWSDCDEPNVVAIKFQGNPKSRSVLDYAKFDLCKSKWHRSLRDFLPHIIDCEPQQCFWSDSMTSSKANGTNKLGIWWTLNDLSSAILSPAPSVWDLNYEWRVRRPSMAIT